MNNEKKSVVGFSFDYFLVINVVLRSTTFRKYLIKNSDVNFRNFQYHFIGISDITDLFYI